MDVTIPHTRLVSYSYGSASWDTVLRPNQGNVTTPLGQDYTAVRSVLQPSLIYYNQQMTWEFDTSAYIGEPNAIIDIQIPSFSPAPGVDEQISPLVAILGPFNEFPEIPHLYTPEELAGAYQASFNSDTLQYRFPGFDWILEDKIVVSIASWNCVTEDTPATPPDTSVQYIYGRWIDDTANAYATITFARTGNTLINSFSL